MLTKRIIPCLDMKNGRVVEGIGFKNLQDAGDPAELAILYEDQGADELVLLDVAASREKRDTLMDVVRRTSDGVNIPFTVGGGVRTVKDVRKILLNGADKVTINTASVLKPSLLTESAKSFGSQCIVLAVDAKRISPGSWEVYVSGGRTPTGIDALEWIRKAVDLGAGEILLTSMDGDGTLAGYDIELTRTVAEAVQVPLIASGGAGTLQHFADVLTQGKADAALAASLFHDKVLTVGEVKAFLLEQGLPIRPERDGWQVGEGMD